MVVVGLVEKGEQKSVVAEGQLDEETLQFHPARGTSTLVAFRLAP